MKRITTLLLTILSILYTTSCSDIRFGDKFLGSQPESSGADLEKMFSSAVNAEKVLTKAYTYLPYGIPTGPGANNKLGVNTLESITDLQQSFRDNISDGPINLYYNGALSANVNNQQKGSEAYRFGDENEYNAIRYAYFYLENIDRVPDLTDDQKRVKKAEAKAIVALSYAEMLRYIGGLPWIDHAIQPNEELQFPRLTFGETVDHIVALLDEAAADLPWEYSSVDNGRLTKAGIMALKVRVLLFAASPTFNSDTPWHPNADEYTRYPSYQKERWTKVIDAAKAFFNELNRRGVYQLVMPTEETALARQLAFRSAYSDRESSEVLISTRRGYNAVNTHNDLYSQRYYSGPTLNYVNMFSWADGTDFPEDFDWSNPAKDPFFTNGEPNRDPRLYETVVVPGDRWFNGNYAPVYVNHPNYRPTSGFGMMKFIYRENSDRANKPAHWPYMRLPEVMLSYAEAINEVNGGPDAIAYEMVNKIRHRVGLPDLAPGLSKETFRAAVLHERALEFGYEEVRWFDLVRWGRKDDFTKTLYGLLSRADNHASPTSFTYTPFKLNERNWAKNWDAKWYLAPIPQDEINKKYGMIQNPGW